METNSKSFTLVGVLAVVVVVAILVSLMLPAIQSARQAGGHRSITALEGDEASPAESLGTALKNTHDALALAEIEPNAEQTPAAAQTGSALKDRKIIYTAKIELDVEDFSAASEKVLALVKQCAGYIADSTVSGTSGESRHAHWSIRVPVDRFDEFVDSAKSLGELVSANTNSQDVSEEYFDVEARIRNKTKEEARLLELLENRPGKLEDVIAVERELSRVREEVERMQARIRLLTDRTALTTVQLSVTEVRRYEPEQAASLATRIGRSFDGSLFALRSVGELLVVGIVALSPWLAVLAVIAGAAYPLLRPFLRRPVAPKGIGG